MEQMTPSQLVKAYIALREKKAALKKQYDEQVAAIESAQGKVEAALLSAMTEMGVESLRTENGTAYVTLQTSVTVADQDAFKEFCLRQDDPFEFVDVRASKSAVLAFKEATGGNLPPGVNYRATRAVNFRAS